MQPRVRFGWLVGAAALAGLLAPSPAFSDDALVAQGRGILAAHCARCHNIEPTGASPVAEAPPFRTLSQKYPVRSLAEALAEGIVTGHNDMPQFVFTPDEIDAILACLESLNPPPR